MDLACWLFGNRPSAIYTIGRGAVPLPEYVQAHLGFDGGGISAIDYTRTLPRGDGYQSLTLIGSAGAAYFDDHGNMQLLFAGGHPAALCSNDGDLPILNQLKEFVAALEENRDPLCLGHEALGALEIAEIAASSLASGNVAHPAERSADEADSLPRQRG